MLAEELALHECFTLIFKKFCLLLCLSVASLSQLYNNHVWKTLEKRKKKKKSRVNVKNKKIGHKVFFFFFLKTLSISVSAGVYCVFKVYLWPKNHAGLHKMLWFSRLFQNFPDVWDSCRWAPIFLLVLHLHDEFHPKYIDQFMTKSIPLCV